jgi:hypothetical protein
MCEEGWYIIIQLDVRTHPVQQYPGVHPQSLSDHPLFADCQALVRYISVNAGKRPQVVSKWNANPMVKRGWRLVGELFNYSWAYQIFIFGLTFGIWASIFFPCLWLYKYNNTGRTYEAAMIKERAHKKKLKDIEEAEEAAERAAEEAAAAEGGNSDEE